MAIVPGVGAGKTPEAGAQLKFPPGFMGYNREPDLSLRRVSTLDGATRVASQLEHDRGVYVRPPVQTVEYGEGNIKKSHYVTGAGGYNQRAVPAPDSADDMSQEQYMMAAAQNAPDQRLRMQQELLLTAKQNFLNTRVIPTDYAANTHNMVDNLMSLAKTKKTGGLA
jgi:hypothetical protein